MNWKEPYIRDVSSVYPPIRVVLRLSPKIFVDILEEKLSEKFSPFIKVVIGERNDATDTLYYSVYVKFYYKGMHYQSCCTTQELDTDTVVHVCSSLSREIRQCMERN